ncbi:MAG: hypothetical protein J6S56_06425 [Bacteroidales bacterium]|nr:hypothetical protein [Bacteroidales bacterium]
MKRLIRFFTLFLLVLLTLAGCTKTFTIKVTSNNDEWGQVSGSGTYKKGEVVTISAMPAVGYYFNGWNDGINTNPREITVTGNAEYVAIFSDTPGGGTEGALEVSGSISANTTWPDRGVAVDYIIDGRFYVEGNALLTIEPGVTIMFTGTYGGIFVEENAGLCMKGTASNPIILTGPTNNPNVGAWDCVYVTSNRNDNQFEYVNFINGGSGDAVVSVNGKLSMKHCLINGALHYGVLVNGNLSAFENNTIKNTEYPIFLNEQEKVGCFGTGNTYTNNAKNMIVIDDYWLDESNVTANYTNQGIPYFLKAGVHVDGTATMKVNAGVEFVLDYDQSVSVTSNALIQVNGTASQPVVFRGLQNESGYWNGIEIYSSRQTNGGNNLTYCNIQNAGKDAQEAALYTWEETRVALSNLNISGSHGYGMMISIPIDWDTEQYDFSNYHVTASGLAFSNCASGNIFERNKEQVYSSMPGAKNLARR